LAEAAKATATCCLALTRSVADELHEKDSPAVVALTVSERVELALRLGAEKQAVPAPSCSPRLATLTELAHNACGDPGSGSSAATSHHLVAAQ
jgi:hypothetical protein